MRGCLKEGCCGITMQDGFEYYVCQSHYNHIIKRVNRGGPHKLPMTREYREYLEKKVTERRKAMEENLAKEPGEATQTAPADKDLTGRQ